MKTKKCKHCQTDIPKKAKVCPNCKKKQGNTVLTIFLVLFILGLFFGNSDSKKTETSNANSLNIETTENTNAIETEIVENTETTETTKVALPEDNTTIGQKNALASAKSYLDFKGFSYEGLIEQLEYEKYTNEDAVYAADNCGADWNKEALESAKSYLDFKAFSYTGLIEQLEYEKFTTEQATYAADNCGANWNEQAAKCAESYLDFTSFSRDSLIEQLEYEGFTNEQAIYGVNAVGY